MVNPETLALAFWAKDRTSAEHHALAWAAAEPNIASARVVEAVEREDRLESWVVTVAIDWVTRDEPLTLGLVG